MNNPFDIIKAFHSKAWDKINDRDKARNFFMINRTCSIAYPLQANSFNNIKIQPDRVVDFWKIFITSKHKSVPSFIWTKTIKKDKPVLAISIYHSANDFFYIKRYIEEMNLGYKFYIKKV